MSACVPYYSVTKVIETVAPNHAHVDQNYVRMGRDKVWSTMKPSTAEPGFYSASAAMVVIVIVITIHRVIITHTVELLDCCY